MSSFGLKSRLVIRALVSDMAKGSVPLTVQSWTEIHDHVDANDYLLMFEEIADQPWSDEIISMANEIVEDVTGWLMIMHEHGEPTLIQMICSIPVDEDFN